MHEWLSGGVSPRQGEGRGFESRLVLFILPEKESSGKLLDLSFPGAFYTIIIPVDKIHR